MTEHNMERKVRHQVTCVDVRVSARVRDLQAAQERRPADKRIKRALQAIKKHGWQA